MRFSNRTPSNLEPNRLARALDDARRSGRTLIDLTLSNPTRAGIAYPDDLLNALANSPGLLYAPEAFGTPLARRAVADDYARRGIAIDPARVVLTASTSEAYSILFKLLADPGDEILVPRPSYPLFEHLTRLDAVRAVYYDLEYHGRWTIDIDSVRSALTSRTRALLLVSPNNPTGSFVSRIELAALARLCEPRGVAIVADEVFADYSLDVSGTSRPASAIEAADVLTFALGGLSKSAGLPQVKVGWIAAAGPEPLLSEALRRLELVCDTYLSVSTPAQLALPDLLDRGAAVRQAIQARISTNHEKLRALAAGAPAATVLRAEGGWYAVVQVPAIVPEEDLVLGLLSNDGVLVHPGYFFDFAREAFLVVSLLPPPDAFAEGVRRLLARAAPGLHAPRP